MMSTESFSSPFFVSSLFFAIISAIDFSGSSNNCDIFCIGLWTFLWIHFDILNYITIHNLWGIYWKFKRFGTYKYILMKVNNKYWNWKFLKFSQQLSKWLIVKGLWKVYDLVLSIAALYFTKILISMIIIQPINACLYPLIHIPEIIIFLIN